MADLKSGLEQAFELVDRRQNDAALEIVNELLADLEPPNRITDIPPGQSTLYDWLQLAKKSLQGDEGVIVTPKIALRSALALVH